jgi:hypothetical protein
MTGYYVVVGGGGGGIVVCFTFFLAYTSNISPTRILFFGFCGRDLPTPKLGSTRATQEVLTNLQSPV